MQTGTCGLVHLVTGGTGAGKTHYSIQLATKLRGVRFSIDDWMTRLFWMDGPQPPSFEWAMERIGRCEAQIRCEVETLARLGIPSILDLGFTRADHRAAFVDFATEIGTSATLHWINISAEQRWQRVLQRNEEQGVTFAMDVNRAMFDFMEGEWEPPSDKELSDFKGQIIRS